MKKLLLIVSLCVMSMSCVNATQWVNIETNSNKFLIYVDNDFIQLQEPDICFYPLLVKEPNKKPVVLFVKADYNLDKAGIITIQDYDANNYNPNMIFSNYKAYLKPVVPDTVLDYSYRYMSCRYLESNSAQVRCSYDKKEAELEEIGIVRISNRYTNTDKARINAKSQINKNWKLPEQGKNRDAHVHVVIGKKGALEGFSFVKSTGNDLADRAIISAIELTAPFKNLENTSMSVYFKAGLFSKGVR